MHIELDPADHEEPTWEVRHPRRRRLDGRTRAILSAAAAAAVVVNAGAAWAYWQITGSGTGRVHAGTAVELALRGRTDLNRPLQPGAIGNLTVTVSNDYEFPIRITSITAGVGNIVADDEHRDAGCKAHTVDMTRSRFAVSWDVARNNVAAFTIRDGLTMRTDASAACAGAVFTVPVKAFGISRSSE